MIPLATAVFHESGDEFGIGSTGEQDASATKPLFTDRTPLDALQNPAPGKERAPPRKEKTTGTGIELTEG